MQLNATAVAWLMGICIVQQWAALPSTVVQMIAVALGFALCLLARALLPPWRVIALCLGVSLLAMSWTVWLAEARLSDRLSSEENNKVTRVRITVSDLPTALNNGAGVRFIGEIEKPVPAGLPSRVMVFWPKACTRGCEQVVVPGQRWRMALRFRQPRARINFAGIDAEGWMFQQGLRASATVRGTPVRLEDISGWQPRIWIEQLRARIRTRLKHWLGHEREINVMVALAIGDQQGVSREDWEVFGLTGITHLVSISGSHVTLIAALGAGVIAALYRRMSWRGRRLVELVPVRLVFVWAAGVLAFLYCLLAGWGVPAQRTFFMLAAAAVSLSGRIPLTGMQAILAAATFMTALDPWAVLSTGFWLSFGAMLILILLATRVMANPQSTNSRWQSVKTSVLLAARLQWIMTLAIVPVTIYLFGQVSMIGLLANAWAIPWITFIATPATLLASAATLLPLPDSVLSPVAWVAHFTLSLSLLPVRWLAGFDGLSVETPAIGIWLLLTGLIGVGLALLMPPWRGRWLAWLWLLPAVISVPPAPAPGHWRVTAFDVGQGGAVLVQTHSQNLLFDTGWRYKDTNAVDRVLLPELRALGVKHLDRVVISHPDLDHVGGLNRLEQVRSIGQLIGSGLQRADVTVCRANQSWIIDGVSFAFLHPDSQCGEHALQGLKRNRCSCVLAISGHQHKVLLTGDIDAQVEQSLIKRITTPFDVAMVAHHGSSSSSSTAWVRAIAATHAVIQAGHYNRFGHPHAKVVKTWQNHGSRLWVSSWHGAVQFESSAAGLTVHYARDIRRRYWHESLADLQ